MMIQMFLFLRFSFSVAQAVVFSTSSRWFNYRHAANAFNVANILLKNKVQPKNLFLAVGENPVYNVRNPYPGKIYVDDQRSIDVYVTPNISDDNVDIKTFRNVLLRGPVSHDVSPLVKMNGGRMLLYLTGHGGDEFLKFREIDQMKAKEFAEIISGMKRNLKFDELLIILDTCEALSMFKYIDTQGITIIVSSEIRQKSLSTHYDKEYNIPLSDMFTFTMCDLIRKMNPSSSLNELVQKIKERGIGSDPRIVQFRCKKNPSQMTLKEWFYP
jgi:phosphatidylinositol glycan class K